MFHWLSRPAGKPPQRGKALTASGTYGFQNPRRSGHLKKGSFTMGLGNTFKHGDQSGCQEIDAVDYQVFRG
jgi:hypothetical protein